MHMLKIAICSPIHSGAKPRFVQSLARMIAHSYATAIPQPDGSRLPIEIETLVYSTSNIAFSRRKLAEAALQWGADWLLWLDADHIFPADSLLRLLASNQAIVGANYRRRTHDSQVTAYAQDGEGLKPLAPKSDGLEEVAHLGLGLCLVEAEVLRAMAEPYFYDEMLPNGSYVGEDVIFFRKAKAAGFAACVDHGLSREVAHTADVHLWLPAGEKAPAQP
ncbi:MAG: glycosyl transferase family 2 [Alphaproteobacteria bacterium]|nr:glycosyl transferase family 2 [Alphaproteobacteria bacterium]